MEFGLIIEYCKLKFFIWGKFLIMYCKLFWLKIFFDINEVFRNIVFNDLGYFNIWSSFFDYGILVILRVFKIVREDV